MFDKLIPLVAALAAPIVGSMVRSSRRDRLRRNVENYTSLAERVEPHDPESAAQLRALVVSTVAVLLDAERASLNRKFDPGAAFAFLLFAIPGIALFAYGLTVDSWWKWPLLGVSIVWILIVVGAAWDTSSKSHAEGEVRASREP